MKLQIRYSTLTRGLQTAEFSLSGKKESHFNYFPIEKDIAQNAEYGYLFKNLL